jgi:hypothetical protein
METIRGEKSFFDRQIEIDTFKFKSFATEGWARIENTLLLQKRFSVLSVYYLKGIENHKDITKIKENVIENIQNHINFFLSLHFKLLKTLQQPILERWVHRQAFN